MRRFVPAPQVGQTIEDMSLVLLAALGFQLLLEGLNLQVLRFVEFLLAQQFALYRESEAQELFVVLRHARPTALGSLADILHCPRIAQGHNKNAICRCTILAESCVHFLRAIGEDSLSFPTKQELKTHRFSFIWIVTIESCYGFHFRFVDAHVSSSLEL